ncbi:SDR family NAD(P)-dependent oxidoreductase [Neptunicoccus cionae]|uniref:Short-chain dehydrogenase n=1 Tax=Neptunicoccus cionae TaxID=2035344 RepID=A0A916QV00_9RHOB|nr:SDR family NAD(P)-dependent oxidoreductase [Amylibacter cionae]GGA14210.1 short-chain dehydrogenase [Amylibacter cionae]
MSQTWIILGAGSAMGRAFARKAATQGAHLVLAARDQDDLDRTAADCLARGAASAAAVLFDVRKPESFAPIYDAAKANDGIINTAVFVGSMAPQDDVDADPNVGDLTIQDSFTGPVNFLHGLAPIMEARKGGTVLGIGSVAGDRGRIGNYIYGAAKAGFHTYLSGLRNRLNRSGGHVVTVKPGFVDTAMTWGIEGMFLVASPEQIAQDLWTAHEKRKNTLYTPFFWRYIMAIIKSIPEPIFKKLSV